MSAASLDNPAAAGDQARERLLVVEDDPGIGANLERALANAGYGVERVGSVAEALAIAAPPDLVLLDLGLPDGDGLDVAHEYFRRWPALPILMLTARTEEMDVVVGLDAGAADFITKPFRLAELLARVRAQLRHAPSTSGLRVLSDGNVAADPTARRATLDGVEVQMRAKEFDLLVELLKHKGEAVTREALMTNVWDEHWYGSTKTLDVHMSSLRRRLGEAPGQPSRITSLRGVGYRWEISS
ncbi:response regulator transcription factor [Aquihabitans sp. McL0605]|uniref:response regulator transcription factor n=1 Tax=Aquihabitans sp. McL0605 TaxID=3415671 RepID=UPI003CF7EEA9